MFSAVFVSLLLGTTAFLICHWLIHRPKNLPPGPWGLPLLGYRFGPGPTHEQFAKLAQKYGPVFSVRLGPKLLVVLNDGASVRQALLKQADDFSKRSVVSIIRQNFLPVTNKDASIVFGNGQSWSDLRKFCMSTLRTFGMGKKSLEPQINLEARELCEVIRKHGGRPMNPDDILGKATGNVIVQLVTGRRYDYGDAPIQELVESYRKMFTTIPRSDPALAFPCLFYLPIKRYSVLRESVARAKKFAVEQLESHRSTFQADNIRDLVDAYFADDISRMYPVHEFWRVLVDLFGAGMETTSTTLSWAIVYLTMHPNIQRKVQGELDAVVGQGRQPTMDDRPALPYCDATLTEIMRIRPVASTALPHMAARTVSLGDYVIPKGTMVIPNLWAVHHDPNVWKNPAVFDPERFLVDGGHGERVVEKSDAWMPFSVGPRECPGAQLARMEAFLFFTNLFQRFNFRFPPGQTHSLRGVHGLTSAPESYQISATER